MQNAKELRLPASTRLKLSSKLYKFTLVSLQLPWLYFQQDNLACLEYGSFVLSSKKIKLKPMLFPFYPLLKLSVTPAKSSQIEEDAIIKLLSPNEAGW